MVIKPKARKGGTRDHDGQSSAQTHAGERLNDERHRRDAAIAQSVRGEDHRGFLAVPGAKCGQHGGSMQGGKGRE